MGKRESAPEVNAGSMADIAFLLLMFFLVTTVIETDSGLDRMLPRSDGESIEYKQRNILPILVDEQGRLLVNEELTELKDLKDIAIAFYDNGGSREEGAFCDYCQGERNLTSSENPQKAVIVLSTKRETSYGAYIAAQNELVAANSSLRNREANRLYKTDYTLMDLEYRNPQTSKEQKKILAERIKNIQSMFPLNISESELKNQ